MIEVSAFMWTLAIFFGILGFLRGWQREFMVTGGVLLLGFAIFQFDSLIRTIFFGINHDTLFSFQVVALILTVFYTYQMKGIIPGARGASRRDTRDSRDNMIGALVGALNGYLIGGTLWYLLDINQYPLEQFFTAPAASSPSAQALGWMPMMILGGGASGSADLLSTAVLILIFIVLVTL
jgi:hypothetical protein